MTNSRKRTPIVGMTTAVSDKQFKQAEHRRERASAKIAVAQGVDPRPTLAFGDPNRSEKDGKRYVPDVARAVRK